MNFDLNETQLLVQRTARDYATQSILPQAAAIDREERFPFEILKGL
ncbi:MAG: acyl-CoA dehydrogenase family protein, partial [Polyangiales bacterium]